MVKFLAWMLRIGLQDNADAGSTKTYPIRLGAWPVFTYSLGAVPTWPDLGITVIGNLGT